MNKELANVMKGKLVGLPFIDLLCGMVQTLTTDDPADENKIVQKRRPVTYDHNQTGDCAGAEISPIPNTQYKSIIYFEDFGATVIDKVHGLSKFQSSLRLIFWLNRSVTVGNSYAPIAGTAMAMIIQRLANLNPQTFGIFNRLAIKVARIQPQDAALFNRYTYNEPDRQYLRPPFEFFGIDFLCEFFINPKCLEAIAWNQTECY